MRLRRRVILLCLLDHSFSSKKQPVKDGEATEGYVLDKLLSLMNIISQANIYLILCACTQPRILPKTIGNKVHSVSEANTCFSHLLRGIQLKPSIHRRSLFHHFFKSCETHHFPYFTWAFQNPNHVRFLISTHSHDTLNPPFMWVSSSQALHMTLWISKSCDIIPKSTSHMNSL